MHYVGPISTGRCMTCSWVQQQGSGISNGASAERMEGLTGNKKNSVRYYSFLILNKKGRKDHLLKASSTEGANEGANLFISTFTPELIDP